MKHYGFIRFLVRLTVLMALSGILNANGENRKKITDFGFHKNQEGYWKANNRLTALALVNPDHFEDVVRAEENALAVYLNHGNGYLSGKADIRIQLPNTVQELNISRNERLEVLAKLRYRNGLEQEFNLTQLYGARKQKAAQFNRESNALTDSLNFQPVWSWTFPINYGTWPVTAGDIDNDSRVELISSMTHPDSVTVGWLVILENDGDNNYREDVIIPVNFPNSAFHQIKITDWDQDGNKELTCAVGYRIRIWEFYGDKNYQYFDTNISFGGMKASSGIEAVDTDQNGQLELLAIFHDHDAPSWRSLFARYEFIAKNPPYFTFSNVVLKLSGGWFYSFAAGDMDNDGLIDILPGYAQLGGPGPVVMYYEEFDPVQMQFTSRYFTYPYSIVQGFNVIDDLDGDGLNEVFITGVGNGYGGIIYLKSDVPDNYQILWADSTIYRNGAGSSINTALINNRKHVVKAASYFDSGQNTITYYISVLKRQPGNFFSELWAGPEHDPETYIHFFEVLDTDGDFKDNIIYKSLSYIEYALHDVEKTTVSSINEPSPKLINDFILYQNYPNPFNPETKILFDAPKAARVSINIYDIQGKLIKQFSQLFAKPGVNRVVWKGTGDAGNPVASGVYFYRLKIHPHLIKGKAGVGLTRKMILIR